MCHWKIRSQPVGDELVQVVSGGKLTGTYKGV